jgi:hypothetical protein
VFLFAGDIVVLRKILVDEHFKWAERLNLIVSYCLRTVFCLRLNF